jgi:hypothetical protein
MKCIKEQHTKYILELDEKEAAWLKGYMQNTTGPDESSEDRLNRSLLFDVIDIKEF